VIPIPDTGKNKSHRRHIMTDIITQIAIATASASTFALAMLAGYVASNYLTVRKGGRA
jgi:hypothetical protein